MNSFIVAYFLLGLIILTLLFCIVPLIMKYKHGPYSIKESIEIAFVVCLIATTIVFCFSMLTSNLTVKVPKEKTLKEAIEDGSYENYFSNQEQQISLEKMNFSIVPSILYLFVDICILNIGYRKQ